MKKPIVTEEAGLMYGLAVNGEPLFKDNVEEMIDALISTYEWMCSLEPNSNHTIDDVQDWIDRGVNPYSEIEEALKKAGYEL